MGKLEDERDQAERSARELQAVLEEFQSSKSTTPLLLHLAGIEWLTRPVLAQEAEVARAVNEQSTRLEAVEAELAVARANVSALEAEVSAQAGLSTRASDLEAAVREKNLLIGKLRHEAVILNEHLSEALRRLRATSSDGTVDRRLVTNLLVQFLSTPRADAKRFEMLRVLADILGWSDAERQAAGLARATKNSAPPLQSQHQDEVSRCASPAPVSALGPTHTYNVLTRVHPSLSPTCS